MEKSIKSSSINFGLYLGIILILLTGIGYAISLDLFTKIWFGLLLLFTVIIICIISISKSKKLLGGFISFKDAFTSYFLTLLVGLLISGAFSIILFNFIDVEASVELQEKIISSQVERLESYNVPAEIIDETVTKMEEKGNMYSVSNVLQSIVWQLAGFSIVGLIAAAIMKKRNPDAE